MTDLSDDVYYSEEPPPERAPPRRRVAYDPDTVRGGDAYRKAKRHSSLVRSLRYILPAAIVIGVGAFVASVRIIPGEMASLIDSAGIDVSTNSVVMQRPHISGFEGTRRAYEVQAETATQDLDNPKIVTFDKIIGHFGLEDSSVATVNAPAGVYDGTKNLLTLDSGFTAETTSGYGAKFTSALIDIAAGALTARSPLEFRTADGTIRAKAVTILDRGKRVTFTGGVSVTYLPPAELATADGTAGSTKSP